MGEITLKLSNNEAFELTQILELTLDRELRLLKGLKSEAAPATMSKEDQEAIMSTIEHGITQLKFFIKMLEDLQGGKKFKIDPEIVNQSNHRRKRRRRRGRNK